MEIHSAEERFSNLGLSLPPAPAPMGVYKPYLIDGKYLYLSGHGPDQDDEKLMVGRIGRDIDIEEGKVAARQVGLTLLTTISTYGGSINKVKCVIKVLCMVNCVLQFVQHPYVINGCSELFAKGFGEEHGVGVRCALGFGSVP